MNEKIKLQNLQSRFPRGISVFIGMASFEERCSSIISSLNGIPSHCFLFRNINSGGLSEENLRNMLGFTGGRHDVIDVDLDSPITAADAFSSAVNSAAIAGSDGDIFVDVTTFTHEQLLILLRVIDLARLSNRIVVGYTGAAAYSFNTPAENVWLSRGVAQIRSVLGYPGTLVPSKRLHLIVLVGFEHERAAALIERFEPARLTLGVGGAQQSVSTSLHATNERFFTELRRFVDRTRLTFDSVDTFTFSCVDPAMTRDAVLAQVEAGNDFNVVVCPMNTKLSTIGAGLAALKNERIQLAYARAIEYNEAGYSSPSDEVTIYDLACT